MRTIQSSLDFHLHATKPGADFFTWVALKINMPGFRFGVLSLATAYGQLGETESARSAVNELQALQPDYASIARPELGKLFEPELVEHLVDGLRKAGLEIAEADSPKGTASRRPSPP